MFHVGSFCRCPSERPTLSPKSHFPFISSLAFLCMNSRGCCDIGIRNAWYAFVAVILGVSVVGSAAAIGGEDAVVHIDLSLIACMMCSTNSVSVSKNAMHVRHCGCPPVNIKAFLTHRTCCHSVTVSSVSVSQFGTNVGVLTCSALA